MQKAKSILIAAAVLGAVGCGAGGGPPAGHGGGPVPSLLVDEALLTRLVSRAHGGDPAWQALATRCDQRAGATFEAPGGKAYPDFPDVGPGYQGEDYLDPLLELGLCYRVAAASGDARASAWGQAGAHLLDVIATSPSSGGAQPSTDDGYGIRNYGVALAFGFDWLGPALSDDDKARAAATLGAWIDYYDQKGFLRDMPIGNYFAGYLLAKGAAAFAVDDKWLPDVRDRLWGQLVKPAWSTSMSGGGWPEGWEYGPRAILETVELLRSARTARQLDWDTALPQAREQAVYLRHFAWPSLAHMDDQGTVRGGASLAPSTELAVALAGLLALAADDGAPQANDFAQAVLAANGGKQKAWERFLFVDPEAPRAPYTDGPTSYFAPGPGQVAMRASWAADAVWASFVAGPYIDAPDSGEQLFNQGSVAVVAGDQPFVANATGWLPQKTGTSGESFVYQDAYQDKTRKLYNVFYVDDAANPNNPGQAAVGPADAHTRITHVDDDGRTLWARGEHLEDMYAGHVIRSWRRDVVYARPGQFVIYDRTDVSSPSPNDQWLAFHLTGQPDVAGARFSTPMGTIQSLLPSGIAPQIVALPGGAVWRLELHARDRVPAHEWLTTISVGGGPAAAAILNAAGAVLGGAREHAVVFAPDGAGSFGYAAPATTDQDHLVVGLPPSTAYAVSASASNGTLAVSLAPGGSFTSSREGALRFSVTLAGQVSQ